MKVTDAADVTKVTKMILDIIPRSMQQMRIDMRSAQNLDLTVPQFRILGTIYRGNRRISTLADHHGLSAASVSRGVDLLVRRGFLTRTKQGTDRRAVTIQLTKSGKSAYENVQLITETHLRKKLLQMSVIDYKKLLSGLRMLEILFPIKD